MKIDPNDIDVVGEVSFRLPARAFRLDIALREPDRVSLALEYALKLLDVLDLAKPSEIGDFLGFSPTETDSLVMELIDFQLASAASGGKIAITDFGRKIIDEEDPQLKTVRESTTVTFELCAFTNVARSRVFPWLPEIEILNKERASQSEDSAKDAFVDQFPIWRDGLAKQDSDRRKQLAMVLNAVSLGPRDCTISIPIVTAAGGRAYYPDFQDVGAGVSKGRKEDLQNAVRNGLQSFSSPNDQELATDWCEVWDKGFLATQLEKLGSYPSQWITTVGHGGVMIPEEIQPAVLVSRSSAMCARSAIQSLIEQIPSAQIPDELPPIFWSPPDFTAWRAAPSLYDMVDDVRSRFCGGKSGVVMLPRVEDSQRRAFQNMYDTKRGQSSGNFPFDACVALSGNTLPQSIEIIFQPGLWAICIIHASDLRCNFPVPVGVGTANPDAVHAIGEELRFYLSKCRSADVLTFDRGVAGVGAQEPEASAAFLSYIQDSFRV